MKGFTRLMVAAGLAGTLASADNFITNIASTPTMTANINVNMTTQKLEIQVRELQNQLQQAMLKEDGVKLTAQINAALQKLGEVRNNLKNMDEQFNDIQIKQTTKNILDKIDTLKGDINSVSVKNTDSINSMVSKVDARLVDVKNEIARIKQNGSYSLSQANLGNINQQVSKIEKLYDSISRENIKDLYTHVSNINMYLLELDRKISKKQDRFGSASSELSGLRTRISSLSSEIGKLEKGLKADELQKLAVQMKQLAKNASAQDNGAVNALEKKFMALSDEVSRLKSSQKSPANVKKVSQMLDGLKADLNTLGRQEEKNSQIKQNIQQLKQKLDSINGDFVAYKTDKSTGSMSLIPHKSSDTQSKDEFEQFLSEKANQG